MLSFGQTAFFGLAGYSYGVIAINLGANYGYPILALLCALVIAALLALVLGYFMPKVMNSGFGASAKLPIMKSKSIGPSFGV